ncbi:nucleoid-associated protein YejK [Idiomarina xiamenensis]|nr:nucleoid-associated protein YejK [Idiomarina xiamenensis]
MVTQPTAEDSENMQLQVHHSIIHQFYHDQQQIGLRLASQPLSSDDQVVTLLEDLNDSYNAKPSKGYASFVDEQDDAEAPEFPRLLTTWLAAPEQFVQFSQDAARLLQTELEKYGFLQPGFLLLSHYRQLANEYLLVSFLPIRDGVTIAADLSVDRSSQLDLSRVQLAARIDLTEWQAHPQDASYISFIKGRAGRKVSDFFLDFLGCTERVNARQQTQQLVDQVQAYVRDQQLPQEQAGDVRQQVYSYCDEQWQQGEPVRVKELSEQLQNQHQTATSFADFRQEFTQSATDTDAADSNDEFPADKGTLRRLVKFQGQGGGVSVGFDQTLLGSRVDYDPQTDTLKIIGTPPNLRDQLRRYFGIDS